MSDADSARNTLTALILALASGSGAGFMLTRLDREARRLYQGERYWYPKKKRGTEENEVQRIRRNIKILYVACLFGSSTVVLYLVAKYLRLIEVIE